ncbi:MAG TPA: SRPBCC domain-containing protein [Bauldia sp.]|nr:SRPBCC domain-containing protein [Bauldia sp.]
MFKWLFGKGEDASPATGGNAEVVVVSRRVPVSREQAFAAFVDHFDAWWPRERRLAGGAIAIDGRYLGAVREAGETIGAVLSFQRPEHIVIAWQIGPGGKHESSEGSASRIDVRFVAIDANTTEVVVVHRDFARHGDGWQGYRAEMGGKSGWPALIEAYARTLG